jgi:uncharacterized protein YndB with AHSA1/START domain
VEVTYVFDAPRDAVFAAWTDPGQVAKWWAPDGLEVDGVEIDPRPGGHFRLTMVDTKAGTRFPYRSEIVDFEPPSLIVLRAEAIPDAGIEETVTRVVLEDEGGRTRMTVTSGPYEGDARRDAEAGWHDLIGNLERLLAEG